MSPLPWFKCNPRDMNEGMMGMPPEERGVYITVLNLIYTRGAPIGDDAAWIASWCCCSVKAWKKIRASLIVKGKLFEVSVNGEPCLMNRRAAEEIAEREKLLESRAGAGAKGGSKKRAEPSKNSDLGQASGEQTASKDQPIKIEDTEQKKEANASFVAGTPGDDARTAFEEWNALASRLGLPTARTLDRRRRGAIKARLADGGLDAWRLALLAVERSPHCRGENDRGWRADLDFVCQPKSWNRLLEGAYGAPDPKSQGPPGLGDYAARHMPIQLNASLDDLKALMDAELGDAA